MGKTSEQRIVDNEVVFRQRNQAIQKGFDELAKIAHEDNQAHLIDTSDIALQFYCECSDENCTKRIAVRPSLYNEVHKHRARFLVVPGHEVPSLEQVLEKTPEYFIIEKFKTPPAHVSKLSPTPVDNS
jgi:hypothetical protein